MEVVSAVKLKSMVSLILDIDWLGTKEFCEKYGFQTPYFTGEVKSSADQFLNLDIKKHKMYVEYAKFLSKKLSIDMFIGDRAIFEGFEIGSPEGHEVLLKKGSPKVYCFLKNEFRITLSRDNDAHRIEDLIENDEFLLNESAVIRTNSYLSFLFK